MQINKIIILIKINNVNIKYFSNILCLMLICCKMYLKFLTQVKLN